MRVDNLPFLSSRWGRSCLTGRLRTSPMTTLLAFSRPCGQKMANMSTVAIVVSYCRHKIIDITENMFINLNTYKPAIELFE